MKKRAAGASRAIDHLFRQDLKVVAVVRLLIAHVADRAEPAAADSDNLIAFAQGANGDRTDRRLEPGHIAAGGDNTESTRCSAHAPACVGSLSSVSAPTRALPVYHAPALCG